MTSSERLQMRTILTGAFLIPLTILTIYLVYGAYLFSKWPWFRFSTVMTVLTCLWSFALGFVRVTEGGTSDPFNEAGKASGFFALVGVPIDVLLMYPGPKGLGIYSDSNSLNFVLILAVLHGFGFYFIQSKIDAFMAKDRPIVRIGDQISFDVGSSTKKAIVSDIYTNVTPIWKRGIEAVYLDDKGIGVANDFQWNGKTWELDQDQSFKYFPIPDHLMSRYVELLKPNSE